MQPQAHLYNASFVLPCLLFLLSTEYKLTSCVVERLGKCSQDWDNGVQKVSLLERTLNKYFFLLFENLPYFTLWWFRQCHPTLRLLALVAIKHVRKAEKRCWTPRHSIMRYICNKTLGMHTVNQFLTCLPWAGVLWAYCALSQAWKMPVR